MTLKEKFDVISCKDCDMPFCDNKCTMLSDWELDKLEKIADEFAIGFAEWFSDNTLRVDLNAYKTFGDNDETKPHTIKELLEIYKNRKV
jgi:hypothetical protein